MKISPILLVLILILSSCHKHEELIKPEGYLEATDINKLFNLNLEDIKVIEPFDAAKGLKYAINDKAEIEINENSLYVKDDNKSSYITGKAHISFIEIYDKGTMVITNKHTSSTPQSVWTHYHNLPQDDNNLYIHQSVGLFYTQVTQENNNKPISAFYFINAPKSLTDYYKTEDNLYRIGENIGSTENGIFRWSQPQFYSDVNSESNIYKLLYSKFTWNGALVPTKKHTYHNTSSKYFEKPAGLDDNNSRIFIALEGYNNGLGIEQSKVTDGIKAHYILVVGNNNNFKYAIKKSQTTIANDKITFTVDELKDATPKELREIVNALP